MTIVCVRIEKGVVREPVFTDTEGVMVSVDIVDPTTGEEVAFIPEVVVDPTIAQDLYVRSEEEA